MLKTGPESDTHRLMTGLKTPGVRLSSALAMGLFTVLSSVLMIMLASFNAFFAFRTYAVVCLQHGLVMDRSDQCQVFMHAGYQDRHNGLVILIGISALSSGV